MTTGLPSTILREIEKMRAKLYPGGRRCTADDSITGERCITILERRNAGLECHTHSPQGSTERAMLEDAEVTP